MLQIPWLVWAQLHGGYAEAKLRFTVLGPFEVTSEGVPCTPSAPKVRQVLALLVLRPHQAVGIESLISELWENDPPRSAVTTAQTYIYQLRRLFSQLRTVDETRDSIITRPPGYLLDVTDSQIDASSFTTLVENGRSLLNTDVELAAKTLREALSMWRGPMLTNVTCGPLLCSYVAYYQERYTSALQLRIMADMKLGRHHELIAELKSLVLEYPLNEWLHAQLIVALAKAGRRADALQAYQKVRRLLDVELGLEPSPDLQRLQIGLLRSHDVLPAEFEPPLCAAL
jgi:SARP family transcriptional regulator, regulator of embCAB operon